VKDSFATFLLFLWQLVFQRVLYFFSIDCHTSVISHRTAASGSPDGNERTKLRYFSTTSNLTENIPMQLTYRGCDYQLNVGSIARHLGQRFATYRGVAYDISAPTTDMPLMGRSVHLIYRGVPYFPTRKTSNINPDSLSPWIA
jgi:hypothetical protein